MLGFNSLARRALTQKPVVEFVLSAAQGSYALTGEAVTFKAPEVVANGAFALTGQAAILSQQLSAAQGAYALTGESAAFFGGFGAGQGAFALTEEALVFATREIAPQNACALSGGTVAFLGQFVTALGSSTLAGLPVAEADDFVAQCGLFAFTGDGAFLSYDILGGGGDIITGGTFSRKRWHDLLDMQARERAAERRRAADDRLRKRAADRRRRMAEAETARAAREAEKARGDALSDAMAVVHLAAAARGLARLRDIAQAAGAQARHGVAAATQQSALDQDDEDVIALLIGMVK